MTPIRLFAAAAVSALIAMPAMAQTPAPEQPQTPEVPATTDAPSTMPGDATMPETSIVEPAAPSAAVASTDASANVTTRVVTNGPVADTAENRAKFQPLSNAGRRTKPAGN